jgi:hypothetical protein
MSLHQPAKTTSQHRYIEQQCSLQKKMKIVSELESDGSEPHKTGKSETTSVREAGRPKEAAKKSDASNAIQPARVFEDAEYFGAKFESFWNRLFSNFSAYDENSEFELHPNFVSFSVKFRSSTCY